MMSVHVHSIWSSRLIMAATVAALLLPLAASLHERGLALLPGLAAAAAIALLWHLAFEQVRNRAHTWSWAATAIVFAVLAPPEVPLWQQALAVSFGVVFGEQVFGGWGRNFLNPAAVAVAFLLFSFPAAVSGLGGMTLAIASAAAGLGLLAAGLISWRVISGFAVAVLGSAIVSTSGQNWDWVVSGYMVFGLFFLVCDPVSAASTNAGRWAYGALAGFLTAVLGQAGNGPGSVHVIIFAALLASLFAPLIDRIVIEVHVRRRSRRDG